MRCSLSFLLMILMITHSDLSAQCKTYQLNTKRDTINCTDFQNHKQGDWVIKVTDNHGEPGYREEGFYKDDKKEGAWTRYNLMGDTIANENYKWGCKNGVQDYYNIIGLVREESWKAIDPKNPYDTVRVYDLNTPDKYDLRVVKVDASSVKHGTWTYYDPELGAITKTEEYVIDQLVSNKKKTISQLNDSVIAAQKNLSDTLSKKKPAEVLNYEKKNAKKKIKVRDGATGVP